MTRINLPPNTLYSWTFYRIERPEDVPPITSLACGILLYSAAVISLCSQLYIFPALVIFTACPAQLVILGKILPTAYIVLGAVIVRIVYVIFMNCNAQTSYIACADLSTPKQCAEAVARNAIYLSSAPFRESRGLLPENEEKNTIDCSAFGTPWIGPVTHFMEKLHKLGEKNTIKTLCFVVPDKKPEKDIAELNVLHMHEITGLEEIIIRGFKGKFEQSHIDTIFKYQKNLKVIQFNDEEIPKQKSPAAIISSPLSQKDADVLRIDQSIVSGILSKAIKPDTIGIHPIDTTDPESVDTAERNFLASTPDDSPFIKWAVKLKISNGDLDIKRLHQLCTHLIEQQALGKGMICCLTIERIAEEVDQKKWMGYLRAFIQLLPFSANCYLDFRELSSDHAEAIKKDLFLKQRMSLVHAKNARDVLGAIICDSIQADSRNTLPYLSKEVWSALSKEELSAFRCSNELQFYIELLQHPTEKGKPRYNPALITYPIEKGHTQVTQEMIADIFQPYPRKKLIIQVEIFGKHWARGLATGLGRFDTEFSKKPASYSSKIVHINGLKTGGMANFNEFLACLEKCRFKLKGVRYLVLDNFRIEIADLKGLREWFPDLHFITTKLSEVTLESDLKKDYTPFIGQLAVWVHNEEEKIAQKLDAAAKCYMKGIPYPGTSESISHILPGLVTCIHLNNILPDTYKTKLGSLDEKNLRTVVDKYIKPHYNFQSIVFKGERFNSKTLKLLSQVLPERQQTTRLFLGDALIGWTPATLGQLDEHVAFKESLSLFLKKGYTSLNFFKEYTSRNVFADSAHFNMRNLIPARGHYDTEPDRTSLIAKVKEELTSLLNVPEYKGDYEVVFNAKTFPPGYKRGSTGLWTPSATLVGGLFTRRSNECEVYLWEKSE